MNTVGCDNIAIGDALVSNTGGQAKNHTLLDHYDVHTIVITNNFPVLILWECEQKHEHRFHFMARLCNYFAEVIG